MGGESRGRRRGVAASGWREGRAGFCRAAASLSSRPSLLPAALKPGLAKLGVALTPSHWHVLSATSAQPAAAGSRPGQATFLTPGALSRQYWCSFSPCTVQQRPPSIRPGPILLGNARIRHPHHPEDTGPGFIPCPVQRTRSWRAVWRHLQSCRAVSLSTVLRPGHKTKAARLASRLVACSWPLCCQTSTRNRSVLT